jgi:meiotically up-regulated gene 157 (Mug157) protein
MKRFPANLGAAVVAFVLAIAAPGRANGLETDSATEALHRAAGSYGAAVQTFDGGMARQGDATPLAAPAKPASASEAASPLDNYINGIAVSDAYAQKTFQQCLPNTLQTTVRAKDDGTTFVITGDIPAMWVRDSCAQVNPYVYIAKGNPALQKVIRGVILSHVRHFNSSDPDAPFINSWKDDNTPWERKLEPDGIAYVIRLTWLYWKITGDDSWAHMSGDFDARKAFDRAVDMLKAKTGSTGMVQCPNRPSDDWTKYPYLVPTNMFLAATLPKLAEMYSALWRDPAKSGDCDGLARGIRAGIQRHGTFKHPLHGTIWAYEVDGNGNTLLMDDANIPSLLSAPYLEYCAISDPIYQNTRKFILSPDNPTYASGSKGAGVGSPHTPGNKVWPMSVMMQALTTDDPKETQGLLKELDNLDDGTHYMHEGVNPNNPADYSRPQFAWANSLYAELVMKKELGLNYYPGKGTYVKPELNADWNHVNMNLPVAFGNALGITLHLSGQGDDITSATVNGHAVQVDPQKGVKITGDASDVVIQTGPSR